MSTSYVEAVAAAEAARKAAVVAGKSGDLAKMSEALKAVEAAEAAVPMAAATGLRDAFRLFAQIPEVALLLSVAPPTISLNRSDEGFGDTDRSTWNVSIGHAPVRNSTPRAPRAEGEPIAKGRHRIIPAWDESARLTSREFLDGCQERGLDEGRVAKVYAAIQKAKDTGKASPGFDSTVKALVGAGHGKFEE